MLDVTRFKDTIAFLTSSSHFCLAYSGGLDSTVLLHLFVKLRKESQISLRAIHINHGLSPHASRWEQLCQDNASAQDVPIEVHHIKIQKNAQESLEAIARTLRYDLFESLLQPREVLVTAHHCNDQAETLLLQLLRGCGPKGLAGMPNAAIFGEGQLIRPLLQYSRSELREYATAQGLQWVEDESNGNNSFDRNYLRNAVLPLIEKRWPGAVQTLARTSQHCATAEKFIEEQVSKHFVSIFNSSNNSLWLEPLLGLEKTTQAYLIRYWLQKLKLPLPNTKKLETLLSQLTCRQDAKLLITWGQVEIRRYDNALFALNNISRHNPDEIIPWDLQDDLVLPCELGTVRVKDVLQAGLVLESPRITIRFRKGGERCTLLNRSHSHSLKKLFQHWRVPPWLRDRIPLLYDDDKLKAIIGYAICQ